jgi:hypothetical protein
MTPPTATDGASSDVAASTRLHCMGGGAAPPGLAGDLERLTALPHEALQKLWQVLSPSLADVIAPQTEELLDLFCAAFKIDKQELGRAIKACRFVIREAAQRDLPAGRLAEDLERLCPRHPLVKELVLAGYDSAKSQLRREILRSALADHGKLLVGVKWRLDAVQASERGTQLQAPVALLTLHYREGADAGRVTLQVLPDMMGELKIACEKMLG